MKLVLGCVVELDEAVECPHLTEVLNQCYVRVPSFKEKTALASNDSKNKVSMVFHVAGHKRLP